MPFDQHKNLAVTTVTAPPLPATSGTSLGVTSGEGARFPAAPFNVTIWPASQPPTPVNAEVARVTARAGDTLTITRAQEGTAARSIVAGDLIAETITAKALTDIESGTNFTQLAATGNITIGGNVVVGPSGSADIRQNTVDGADTGSLVFCGGGGAAGDRGASVNLLGNEHTYGGGRLILQAGNTATGRIEFTTGVGVVRGTIYPSGGLSWGGTVDPGVGALLVGASNVQGTAYVQINPFANGLVQVGVATAAAANVAVFYTPSGIAGYIQTVGTATTYGTSSDARLKRDLGRHTDLDVLRLTLVHDFTWREDGTRGRGVFAQEAAEVAPFAVAVGTDDRDAEGRLTQPWAVDYAKYVPDLLAGWQAHDATLLELVADNLALTARLTGVERAAFGTSSPPHLLKRCAAWLRDRWASWLPFPVTG